MGAGTAGSIVAARLSEIKQWNVLLLEAGREKLPSAVKVPGYWQDLQRSGLDWGGSTLPEPHLGGKSFDYPQGKGVGGSMNLFAGIYARGHRTDYDSWREMGNAGWGWDYVSPYFEKPVLAGIPVSAQRWLHPATKEFLHRYSAEDAEAWQVFQRQGRKVSAAEIYLGRAKKEERSNLTILSETTVVRVRVERGRAIGVEILREGRVELLKARVAIVLCAGAIQSPAILMRSGIGPVGHLERVGVPVVENLPGVGENFQDHVRAGLKFRMREVRPIAGGWRSKLEYALRRTGPLSSPRVEAGAYWHSQEGLAAPDLQVNFAAGRQDAAEFSLWTVLLRPQSRGYLRLRSADPLELPEIHANGLQDPEDRSRLDAGIEKAKRWGEALGAAQEGLRYGFMWHAAGTCRMGDDRMAVVDSNLRVHGVGGLRVIDASVMPLIPGGNIAMPVMMVAERGADLLRC